MRPVLDWVMGTTTFLVGLFLGFYLSNKISLPVQTKPVYMIEITIEHPTHYVGPFVSEKDCQRRIDQTGPLHPRLKVTCQKFADSNALPDHEIAGPDPLQEPTPP